VYAPPVNGPAGYFLTFTTYGTRLHGDPRGSVLRHDNAVGTPAFAPNPVRNRFERALMTASPMRFTEDQRRMVAMAIAEVCARREWRLHALNVRTNHVHVVVTSEAPIDQVMNTFKAYATRKLRESNLVGGGARTWARHGSTRFLRDEQDVIDAMSYVLDYQGEDLGGTIGPGE